MVLDAQHIAIHGMFVFSCDMAIGEVQDQPAAIGTDKAKNVPAIALDHPAIVEHDRMMELSADGTNQVFLAREKLQKRFTPGSNVNPLSGERLGLGLRREARQREPDGKGEHYQHRHTTLHDILLLFATQRFLPAPQWSHFLATRPCDRMPLCHLLSSVAARHHHQE
jgi:hypothetical protein